MARRMNPAPAQDVTVTLVTLAGEDDVLVKSGTTISDFKIAENLKNANLTDELANPLAPSFKIVEDITIVVTTSKKNG